MSINRVLSYFATACWGWALGLWVAYVVLPKYREPPLVWTYEAREGECRLAVYQVDGSVTTAVDPDCAPFVLVQTEDHWWPMQVPGGHFEFINEAWEWKEDDHDQ